MSFLPKNPFNRKPASVPVAQPAQATSTPDLVEPVKQDENSVLHPDPETPMTSFRKIGTPARDENGKFISKKKTSEPPTAPIEAKPQEPKSGEVPTPAMTDETETKTFSTTPSTGIREPQKSTFYGFQVRKFYDAEWYFSILDILALARIINPTAYLDKLKNNSETKSIITDSIRVFKYKISDETTGEIETINYPDFMQLFPFIRSSSEAEFPGPFPEWLQSMSEIEPN